MKRLVIVGGGFGGLSVAKILAKHPEVKILILDRRNHHLFQPLLYQVAMAGLSPADIATPIRTIFRHRPNVEVLLAEVTNVDLQKQFVDSTAGRFEYDYLVLACGSEHSYFNHAEWEEDAPGLKTLEQATEIRRRIFLSFEQAESNPTQAEPWMTFVIVGGGPTGVELAGSLAEITRFTLKRDFRNIDPRQAKIMLIEAGPRILPSYPEDLSARALKDLQQIGVTTLLNTRVVEMNSDGVSVTTAAKDSPDSSFAKQWIKAKTKIWAAGVRPAKINALLATQLDPQGRVQVTDELCLTAHKNVFVVGDQAHVKDKNGEALPGLAPVAMQQGRYVAQQIERDLRDKPRTPFHYQDKGMMATIGRRKAVALINDLRFHGMGAWLLWLIIHIYFVIGFRNRLLVLWGWMYSYFTYRRGVRLITDRDWRLHKRGLTRI
jgi:NADH dehydrogenase